MEALINNNNNNTDLCTPWKGFQYSENKFPYSAIIFRSVIFLVAPPIAEIGKKKKKKKWRRLPPWTVNNRIHKHGKENFEGFKF